MLRGERPLTVAGPEKSYLEEMNWLLLKNRLIQDCSTAVLLGERIGLHTRGDSFTG